MSWCNARRASLALLLALGACTAGPLYGPTGTDPVSGRGSSILTELRGRIAVEPPLARTDQIVRNALLFALNGEQPVRDPLYKLAFVATGTQTGVSVESGTGVPTAQVYRLQVDYTLTRMADASVVSSGSRFAVAPFDTTIQLYAAQRALLNARENAGQAVARRVMLALAPDLQGEAFAPATAPLPVKR